MGWRIVFAPQAIADLAEAVRHIARDDPETAKRVGQALIDRVTILENFPLLGAPYPKRLGIRKLVSRPYIIFYRTDSEQGRVDILRYWHGARGSEPQLEEETGPTA
jgi:plasmid stabilization system protein ParE